MQRPKTSKIIIIVRGPTKTKNQVTFGSNFDPDLDRVNTWASLFIKRGPFGMFIYILNVGITNLVRSS